MSIQTICDLGISPSGKFCLILKSQDSEDAPQANKWGKLFKECPAQALIELASIQTNSTWQPSWIYWKNLSTHYLDAYAHASSDEKEKPKLISAPDELFEGMVESVPPMLGSEFINKESIEAVWNTINDWVLKETIEQKGMKSFLNHYAPLWHQVGRVCFHLAENRNDPEYAFAFLATYTTCVGKSSREQHLPLGKALEEYAGAKDKKSLFRLLEPVENAATRQPWVRELVDSAEIYHPLAWTPDEAHQFLKSIPELKEAGLTVRLPDWWKTRPRPRVQVTLKNDNQKEKITKESLLDFNVTIALGDETLSEEEIKALLESDDGLVLLRGQWIEIDKEKLAEALDHWQSVAKDNNKGMSILDGMRLLAGVRQDLSDVEGAEEDLEKSWVFITPSAELKKILKDLRDPSQLKVGIPNLKASLRPYQKIGVSWLNMNADLGLGACLADDMGLGKTIQVLGLLLLRQEIKNKNKHPCLLVLPTSLVANWRGEVDRFAPDLRVLWLHSSEMKKTDMESFLSSKKHKALDIVVTTYGLLRREKRLAEMDWDIVILDEAHAIKNAGTQQTKAVKKLKSRCRIALTGTPMENRLTDLWSLFDFLNPGLLGSLKKFQKFTAGLAKRPENPYAPLRRLVSPYILRRLKTDKTVISDLPDKTEVIAWCGLTKRQVALYSKLVNELKSVLEESQSNSDSSPMQRRGLILASLMRFKQICNHPSQFLSDGGYEAKDSGKFSRLREIATMVHERREKMLVFSQFKEIAEPLSSFLESIFGRAGLLLHGGVNVKKRAGLVKEFQHEDGPPFMILSLKAGGVGLNLTEASHVVHFDRWWNPSVENQATDRAFRIGQKRNVLVHKFSCRGTIEERIDRMLAEKSKLAADVVGAGGGEALLTEMSDKQLLDTLRLDLERAAE